MITVNQLTALGFKRDAPRFHEPEFSYDMFTLKVNESYLGCTIDYDNKGNYTRHYFDLNDRQLEGRALTINDIKILKEIL